VLLIVSLSRTSRLPAADYIVGIFFYPLSAASVQDTLQCGGGDKFSSRRAVNVTPTRANVKLPITSFFEANEDE